jgi:hypothetical protein
MIVDFLLLTYSFFLLLSEITVSLGHPNSYKDELPQSGYAAAKGYNFIPHFFLLCKVYAMAMRDLCAEI